MRTKSPPATTLGAYEIHTAWEGFSSIRHVASGEIMHSRTPPMEEARGLYIEQSNLAERVRLSADDGANATAPLVVWDAGLGAAANAMAAIQCYEEEAARGPVRPLRIVSFENDLDSLRLACRHGGDFPYLLHGAPGAILEEGRWQSPEHAGLSWLLLQGDFLERMGAAPAPPDLIFYDMFSTKTCRDLWTFAAFRKLFDACAGRPAELFTYTCSTANRAGLLAAGFHVARGRRSGGKLETTIALTPEARRGPPPCRHELLGADWLGKWGRSKARFPAEIPEEEHAAFAGMILEHEQFKHPGSRARL